MKRNNNQDRKENLFFKIRDRIYSGYYWPRERLVEMDLAKEMNVSRTIIRDVLKELSAKRLVKIEPNKGTFVAELSYEKMKNIVDLESVLEGGAAFRAATRLSPQQIEALHKVLNESEKIENPGLWSDYNRKFHKLIISACGNDLLIDAIRNNIEFVKYWFVKLSIPEEITARNRIHREILSALEKKDESQARILMENHVFEALTNLLKKIKSSNPNLMIIDQKAEV